jgi:hypothetical protein
MITQRPLRSLDDWLALCQEPGGDTDSLSQAERVDALQQMARLLAVVLNTHEDAAELINLWLARCKSAHRLLPILGRRQRK